MPAKHLLRLASEGSYSHIYSGGVDERNIFNDDLDYQIFLSFLKEYLSEPGDPASKKTAFTVNGKTFKGTPHQPKNYLNQVELCAYRLTPNAFHLVLHQVSPNSQVSFLRSLATRYSMYFNKKYKRKGSLFSGPYKSILIEDLGKLPEICRSIFLEVDKEGNTGMGAKYTSYKELTGERKTSWIKPPLVLERFAPIQTKAQTFQDKPKSHTPSLMPKALKFASLSIIIYIVLFSIGFNNIRISTASNAGSGNSVASIPSPAATPTQIIILEPSPAPAVAGTETENAPSQTENIQPKEMLIININDGSKSINLRAKATMYSPKVGEAKQGDTFEIISKDKGWYQIMLAQGPAYVSTKYSKVITEGEPSNE